MSHSAKTCKRGTLLVLLTYILLQNIKKIQGGTLWGHLKNFKKKVAQCQKNPKRDLLGTSGFLGFLEKAIMKGGPFGNTQKILKKKSHSAEKNPKGDPLATSCFVGFLEKVKNERGTLWIKFALAGHGLRWFQDCF